MQETSGQSRRRFERYKIDLPVVFFWTDEAGTQQTGEGFTRNIAANGAFIVACHCPPCHTSIQLEIRVRQSDVHGPELRIEATGEVFRTEAAGGMSGFAIHSDRMFRITRLNAGRDVAPLSRNSL